MPLAPPAILKKILIVASDADMRQSLAFMLRAEGYDVAVREAMTPDGEADTMACVIVDENALPKDDKGWISELGRRLIVMCTHQRPERVPDAWTVRKPLLQSSLIDTLRAALVASST